MESTVKRLDDEGSPLGNPSCSHRKATPWRDGRVGVKGFYCPDCRAEEITVSDAPAGVTYDLVRQWQDKPSTRVYAR